jgi:hypothetical protein
MTSTVEVRAFRKIRGQDAYRPTTQAEQEAEARRKIASMPKAERDKRRKLYDSLGLHVVK